MKIAVTGSSGHVGANLILALIAQGHQVRALVHKDHRATKGLMLETIEGDISDLDFLCRAFTGVDVVYHLATHISLLMSGWQQCEKVNVIGTRNVVEACLRSGVRRLIHFSSIHALEQEPKDFPVDEERPLVSSHRCPPYDRSKAAGEKEVQKGIARGLDAVIINPTGIIGPYDYKPSHFGEVLLSLARGTMPVVLDNGFNWVDVRDVVVGAMEVEKRAPAGSRYLLSGHWASLRDLAILTEEVTGSRCPGLSCPMWIADIGAPFATTFSRLLGKRPLFTRVSLMALRGNRYVSHEKATRELDYHPRPLAETITDTLRWFESNGYFTCQRKR